MTKVETYTYEEATNLLGRLPKDLNIVHDLGAGKRDSPVSLQVNQIECEHLVSVEAFEPYLQILLATKPKAKIHDVVKAHLVNSNYKVKNSDLVLMIDVIEHLEKSDALELIAYLKGASKSIVIFTPEGDTIGYSNHDMENPLQEHKSMWSGEDFEALGFDVTVYEKFHTHLGNGQVGAIWATWNQVNDG